MSALTVRPFRRSDRDQLTSLVNLHAQAVIPGASVSVNTVLSQLEREPGEFIVDPWVRERVTLIAEQQQRIVGAAHLLRYGSDSEVGPAYRDFSEIRWLLCWAPDSPFADAEGAGAALSAACLEQFREWGTSTWGADGALPVPGVYGVPEQWPHVRAIYEAAGFRPEGRTEVVLLAPVEELPRRSVPVEGLRLRRTLGINGTRFSACLGDSVLGYLEVEDRSDAGRLLRNGAWADIGNLAIESEHRRRGIATWLLGEAGEYLRLGHMDRLLAYAWPEQDDVLGFLAASGFRELTRTTRGWARKP
ncbi:MAG TPA: GNAT family N-acetyltransferase [Mycobacteriales bacterium]|nr:GNAT family N-acetyltransferase [Mycobacteriales bacterium]